ncbi:MAG: adenylyl-sulfate kinase [Flavobacteriales bacterium]|nr:adenylyl-sulfate kinase [Flavobacteriales bacterium]
MKNLTWHNQAVTKELRAKQKKQKPCLIWLTGLSGSGKSTVATALDSWLYENNYHSYVLDGDNVRLGLNNDLGFTDTDRVENIRRIGETSKLFIDAGVIVVSAFISPFTADRDMVRSLLKDNEFIEVYMSASLETCEKRDPKGLYKKARNGEIPFFTGIDSEYQVPTHHEIEIDTSGISIEEASSQIIKYMINNDFVRKV